MKRMRNKWRNSAAERGMNSLRGSEWAMYGWIMMVVIAVAVVNAV